MRSSAYDYAREKLFEAVRSLVSAESIQMRLTDAAIPLLQLRLNDLPPGELKDRIESVIQKLTTKPLSNEQRYMPRPMTDEAGAELAREIVSLYTEVMGGL